ncbi:coiled-coil domain-containing protein 87 [Suricata suricatta]|uniref:Coiled-coil domain-containing protein 87 n=1 Tax=Suricata suricatta TaxID=37032 RepID=A0A673TTI5_SURSU|nr:coiled-coil domain-containing protein 87 [Suricata suricatta]
MEPCKPKPEPELQRYYHRLLGPLSLFPRKATFPESQKRLPPEVPTPLPLPVSRLTAASLCRQVAKRLANSGLAVRVPTEGRLRFSQVILDELKCSWQEPPAEPSLNHLNNQRLRKRLLVYVLLSSEQLFLHYLHLLKTMSTSASVFTESATLTRLTASLARDCTNLLTSPKVYRCLFADFRTLLKVEQAHRGVHKLRPVGPTGAFKLSPTPWLHSSSSFAQGPPCSLNLNYLIQLSRPQVFLRKPEPDPVKELKSIPQLKKKRLQWLSSMQKKRETDLSSAQIVSLPEYSVTPASGAPPTSHLPLYSQLLHRGQSMPSLREGWKLADELGLPPLPPRPLTPLVLAPESKPELAEDTVAEDLKRMISHTKLKRTHYYSSLDTGLPPLLGALMHRPAAANRLAELQRMLKSLEEEEATGEWGIQGPKSRPLQPQPVTVTLKLGNQAVVQTAAVQVSERKFLDSFHVSGAGVLYNHLAGELEPKLIEAMDRGYFVANNIREVYKELMGRVSLDHFSFDQGPLIEPAANKDLSTYLSSAFLHQEKQHCIINPKLAGLYSQRANVIQSSSDRLSLTSLQASKGGEKWSNKTPWMNWQKTTLSVTDYFKFLTSQETDFLHVIFQMYEKDVPVEVIAPAKESVKIQCPPPLQEDEEPDFVPGEWDWNTVLGHRLGPKRSSPLGEPYKILNLQKRLERLWSMLEVPDKDRLDMAIKYSSNAHLKQLPSLVSAWEKALKPIQLREMLMEKLEWFERQASDPNRFFQKTDMGLSRFLEENQLRNRLHRKINLVQTPLASLLEEIESVFGEPVTFKGRRYLDKMKHDKVEMLYWLQQRRRVHHLARAQKASHQPGLFQKPDSQPLVAPGNTPIIL